ACLRMGSMSCYHVKDARLEVDVLHRQLLLAQQSRRLRSNATVATLTAGDALAGRAAAHAELQVLLFGEGPRHLLGCPDGEGQLPARLAHGDGGADVGSPDLHVLPGRAFLDGQAAPPRPLTTVHRAILEGSRQVVYFGLVDLLVDAFLHVLKYDRELQGKKKAARLDQRPYGLVLVNRGGERGKRKGFVSGDPPGYPSGEPTTTRPFPY
uniref:Uncharacterized protein n=1 Tax=Chelydra serpentina TaxID=8475 RepID=A0A8C3XTI3_CHESE